jgi:SAM-dependent methyltransferase
MVGNMENDMSDVPFKLDLGCGKNKQAGFVGVDERAFEGVDVAHDLRRPWPWSDSSVDEVHCSHFLEHLTGAERIHFFNELYRVLKPGAQARIITPHWSHERAYGDPTHQWPPVCSWTYFYLDRNWREANAPHTDYNCHFIYVLAGCHDPNDQYVAFRNMETKQVLMSRNINVTTDLIATLTKQ